MVKSFQFYFQD